MIKEERTENSQVLGFGLLLLAQILLILLPPLLSDIGHHWFLAGCITVVIFSSIFIVATSKVRLFVGIALGVLSLGGIWTDTHVTSQLSSVVALCTSMAFFGYMGLELAVQMTRYKTFDLQMILAAITGYIFIGIIGGHVVLLVELLWPLSFSFPENYTNYTAMYFSFVTVTTLGYGDVIPQTPIGQAVVMLLSVTGQMYLAIVVALIVGRFAHKK